MEPNHRVGRIVVRIETPPHTQASMYPPPFGSGGGGGGGGANSLPGERVGDLIPTRDLYFVSQTLKKETSAGIFEQSVRG
jgi:hypothetical protein